MSSGDPDRCGVGKPTGRDTAGKDETAGRARGQARRLPGRVTGRRKGRPARVEGQELPAGGVMVSDAAGAFTEMLESYSVKESLPVLEPEPEICSGTGLPVFAT